jgi:hypothetical protein
MHPLDSVPAIRRIETDRTNLLAIEIVGPVTGADVENLYGLLEGAYTLHERIDLLVRWPDGEEVDWQAVAPATVEEARDHVKHHIRRCAAIGDSGEIASLLRALGSGSAEEYRRFPEDEEEQAWAWIDAEAPAAPR